MRASAIAGGSHARAGDGGDRGGRQAARAAAHHGRPPGQRHHPQPGEDRQPACRRRRCVRARWPRRHGRRRGGGASRACGHRPRDDGDPRSAEPPQVRPDVRCHEQAADRRARPPARGRAGPGRAAAHRPELRRLAEQPDRRAGQERGRPARPRPARGNARNPGGDSLPGAGGDNRAPGGPRAALRQPVRARLLGVVCAHAQAQAGSAHRDRCRRVVIPARDRRGRGGGRRPDRRRAGRLQHRRRRACPGGRVAARRGQVRGRQTAAASSGLDRPAGGRRGWAVHDDAGTRQF
jgi:hypothetical protein